MSNSSQIDYDALANQARQQPATAAAPAPAVDYDALANQARQQPAAPAAAPAQPAPPKSLLQRAVDTIVNLPGIQQATGFMKGGEEDLGSLVHMIDQQLSGGDPTAGIPGPWTAGGGMMPSITVPQTARQGIHKVLKPTGDWLMKNTQADNAMQRQGKFMETIAALMLPQTSATEGAALASKAGQTEKASVLFDKAAQLSKFLEGDSVASKLGRIGLHAVRGAGRGYAEGSALESIKTQGEDPEKQQEAGLWSAGLGALMEPAVDQASRFMNDLRAGKYAKAAPETLPPEPRPPTKITDLPEMPEAIPAPVKGEIPPTPRPEPPVKPAPIPAAATVTPRDVGPPPEPPAPVTADRAPLEQRFGEMEQQAAQGTVQTKLGSNELLGDAKEAATHLNNLNEAIDSEEFAALHPDQQHEILRMRNELIERADPANGLPQHVIDKVGDMDSAADLMEKDAIENYNRWGDESGGEFVSLNSELGKLRGKFDAKSLERRSEIEAKLEELAGQGTIGSKIERTLYKSRFADAAVLRDTADAFTKSWKGAERTGGLDAKALRRNWKALVEKRGAERLKGVLGEERYTEMNNSINSFAEEGPIDKAANDAAQAQYKKDLAAHKQAKATAEQEAAAEQTRLETERQAAVDKQTQEYEQQRAQHKQTLQEIRTQDRLAEARNQERYNQEQAVFEANKKARNEAAARRKNVAEENRQLNASNQQQYEQERQAYQELKRKLKPETVNQTVSGVLKHLAKRGSIAANTVLLAKMAGVPHATGAAETIAGLWVAKKIFTNPTALRIMSTMAEKGGNPNLYIPVIADLIAGDQRPHTENETVVPEDKSRGIQPVTLPVLKEPAKEEP